MTARYDVAAIGNAIVDVISPCDEQFLADHDLPKGGMTLIDEDRAALIYDDMVADLETSGGSAANTAAGVASFGDKAAYMGKVAGDALGQVFRDDMKAIGVHFDTPPLADGPATARSLINVTPDGQRTMATFLGASGLLGPADVDEALIEASALTYLEGYLFSEGATYQAFLKAAAAARRSKRQIAFTLSDTFVVAAHRAALLRFIEDEVDILFANETEILALFETEDFDACVREIGARTKLAALTRSEKGSVIVAAAECVTVKAEPVERVIDTTGAGDQYAAGFLFGHARGRSLEECGRLGSIAAAEVISHYGPRPLVRLKDLAAKAGLET
ncbi:MAG: adenosine kinase [Caulobacteraceae bacterium]